MPTAVAAKSEEKKSKAQAPEDFDHEPPQLQYSSGAPAGLPRFLDVSPQRKLAVGAIGDPWEKEADRVAETVASSSEAVGYKGYLNKREGELPGASVVQRRPDSSGVDRSEAPRIVHQALRSPAQPLDATVRPFMESRFGRDFGEVRVHTDPLAAKSAQAVDALAYTVGKDVVFAPDQYAPASTQGKRLLAHELMHVVQQSGGGSTVQAYHASTAAAEPGQAASQAIRDTAVSSLTAGGVAVQRQPAPAPAAAPAAAPLIVRSGDVITVLPLFRGEFVPVEIGLDAATAPYFDADPNLQAALALYLITLFNPPEGPVPETKRFLSGPRVRALIEQDLPTWVNIRQLPSLANLLAVRAAELRKQQVRAGLENWLGVDPGTVDWNVELPSLRTAFMSKATVTTGEEAKLDRGEMFLNMLENEVAGAPTVDGAVTPPDLADLVFQYATEGADYGEGVRKLFAEKFVEDYLAAIAAFRFIPEGFDLARFAPRGTDVAEERRENLIDQFIYAEAEGLATAFLLDRWTSSGVNPEVYLKSMDLEKEQDTVIDYLTDRFMERATKDPSLASSIRELAADKARYDLLRSIVQGGLQSESFNKSLPAIAKLEEAKLDDQQKAILHDPGTYYETSFYLSEATRTILSQVTAGANVAEATVENAQAIAGKANIPKAFGALAFLFEIGVALADLKRTMEEQRSIARQRFAGRMRLSWNKIAETIRNFGKAADDFIETKWIPTVKEVAKNRISKNYADIKKWHDNFGGETPNVVGRYRLAAYALEDVANALESGEQKSATMEGHVLDLSDVPNMRTTVKYLRAKADKLESKKGREEKREDLQKAVDAYKDVMDGIDSEKYKPNHFGPDVYKEARQKLGIGDFEYGVTYGMALRREVVVRQNPFERWAIARYEYVELVYEHNAELIKFAIAGLATIASFLLPGVAAAVLFVIDAGYGIYQAYQAKKQAEAVLDLARLDTDLDIQGVSVADAEKALHDAKMGLFIAIALAAAIPVFMIIRSVYRGIEAGRMLGRLSEVNPALAAKIVEGAGSTRMAAKLLMHFAGDGEKVLRALEHVKDGERLESLIVKIKDAGWTLRLLDLAGGEAGLTPLIARFKNYAKLEELLGKAGSAERLASLFDLAKSERNVVTLLDAMKAEQAEALLNGGLSTEQALAFHSLGDAKTIKNYLQLLETGDPSLKEGMRDLLRLTSQGKLESRVVKETLAKTAEFMSTAKGPAGADYVKRFENIAEEERKLSEARNELNKIKKARGDVTHAQARVDQLTEKVARTREANFPGKIRPADITPEELKVNDALQHQLYEQCQAVKNRMLTAAQRILSKLGIKQSAVYNTLKRPDFEGFRDGVLKKMMDRKPYKNVSQMSDMVRGRFNLQTREQVELVVGELRADPTLSEEVFPRSAEGIPEVEKGYPRYHMVMKDPETGILHEWQVGTEATTRLFQAPEGAIMPIEIPEGLELKPGMEPNIHDIEYDIFGPIQNSKDPANQQLARQLRIPEFRRSVAELAEETGKLGGETGNLDARIAALHKEASEILAKLYAQKGAEFIKHFYH